ncbi:hypothetical protein QTP86_033374 [Hemibagrus guttatus]|nr:hypothetical protein QTP86_033374 [Hemibagrus guttatus]
MEIMNDSQQQNDEKQKKEHTLGTRQDTPWTECQSITYTHNHLHTTNNLEMPISLQYMSLNGGRKLEYPDETPESGGELTSSTHTWLRNQIPNPGGVKPLCPLKCEKYTI